MTRTLVLLMVIATALLSGCTSHPEERPYSVEETHQLALESLYRRGLSYDEYQRAKLALERGQPAAFGFPGMGEVSADRAGLGKARQG